MSERTKVHINIKNSKELEFYLSYTQLVRSLECDGAKVYCGVGSKTTKVIRVDSIPVSPVVTRVQDTLKSGVMSMSYVWLKDGKVESGKDSYLVIDTSKSAKYGVVASNGKWSSDTAWFSYASVGIRSITTPLHSKVYPVPGNDILNIVSSKELISAELIDISGRSVIKREFNEVNDVQLKIQEFENGSYILYIQTIDGFEMHRISISH